MDKNHQNIPLQKDAVIGINNDVSNTPVNKKKPIKKKLIVIFALIGVILSGTVYAMNLLAKSKVVQNSKASALSNICTAQGYEGIPQLGRCNEKTQVYVSRIKNYLGIKYYCCKNTVIKENYDKVCKEMSKDVLNSRNYCQRAWEITCGKGFVASETKCGLGNVNICCVDVIEDTSSKVCQDTGSSEDYCQPTKLSNCGEEYYLDQSLGCSKTMAGLDLYCCRKRKESNNNSSSSTDENINPTETPTVQPTGYTSSNVNSSSIGPCGLKNTQCCDENAWRRCENTTLYCDFITERCLEVTDDICGGLNEMCCGKYVPLTANGGRYVSYCDSSYICRLGGDNENGVCINN